jgi:hypothetical protein
LLTVRRSGGLEVYNINNNQLTGAAFIDAVGLDWQFVGIAPIHGPGASDLVLRNVNTGQFQVYNFANNQITGSAPLGTVGPDWQLGGFRGQFSDRLHGQLGRSGWLKLTARAGEVAAAVQVKA